MATYTIRNTSVQDWRDTMMSKAQFDALAAERRANRAGSGFDEFGKHHSSVGIINEGMSVFNPPSASFPNTVLLGRTASSQIGISKTDMPYVSVNGVVSKLENIASTDTGWKNMIILPPAPAVLPYDATLTTEQIAMGVIKHADASNSGLIVNGKFATDTSGWTGYNAAALSVVSGALRVTTTTTQWATVTQPITCVIGKKYTIEVDVRNKTVTSYLHCFLNTNSSSMASVSVQNGRNTLEFTATQTTHYIGVQIGSDVIGSYTDFDNISVFPADAISRSDLVFLESWHEDVSEKDFVYPLGNVQYLGGVTDGMGAIVSGAFSGSSTYSLFGNWQASGALVGKGYVWSTMTDAQKKSYVSNPENNCYLDGDKVIQVRYRMRVVAGWGDSWGGVDPMNPAGFTKLAYDSSNGNIRVLVQGKQVSRIPEIVYDSTGVYNSSTYFGYAMTDATKLEKSVISYGTFSVTNITNSSSTSYGYESKCFALPLALVHRRNSGIAHSVFNSNGSKLASDSLPWYSTTVSFTSIADCFDSTKLLTASGYIGTTSGRPDGLFYDQVHEGDITDLRMNSAKVEDYNRLISREFNKLVAGTYRGAEGEWGITNKTTSQLGGYVGGVTLVTGTNRIYRSSLQAFGLSLTDIDALLNSGRASLIVNNNIYKLTYNTSTECSASAVIDTSGLIAVGTSSGWTTYNGFIVLSGGNYQSTRTKSNTLTHTDIIGSPVNYPIAWKQSGVSGVPLVVAEDGTSMLPTGALTTFKLSRKANAAPLKVLKSTDSGVTWTALTVTTDYTFSTTTNVLTMVVAPATTDLIMVTYQTHTNMAVSGVNAEVLVVGDVFVSNSQYTTTGNTLINSLLGKIPVGTTAPVSIFNGKCTGYKFYSTPTEKLDIVAENKPAHTTIPNLGTVASPTVKAFPYLTRTNGKARLQLVFKEMKHNGTTWGDHDNTFNIVDNVSTTTDGNGATVLIGQKYAELPYFIGGGE